MTNELTPRTKRIVGLADLVALLAAKANSTAPESRQKNTPMMNVKLMFLVLALTNVAVAEDIIWKATGTLTQVEFSNGLITEFPNAAIGTPFSLIFRFDSSSALSSTLVGESGTRYRYSDAPASVSLTVGDIELHRNQEGFDAIDIWDDFAFSGSGDPASDGFSLIWGVNSAETGGFAQIGLILRGPEHLDIYAGPGLPEEPSPLLLSLALTAVQFIDGGDAVVGNVDNLDEINSVVINSFEATPRQIIEGEDTSLSWNVSNAVECTPLEGQEEWRSTSLELPQGLSIQTIASPGCYTYTLQCTDGLLLVSESLNIEVKLADLIFLDDFEEPCILP